MYFTTVDGLSSGAVVALTLGTCSVLLIAVLVVICVMFMRNQGIKSKPRREPENQLNHRQLELVPYNGVNQAYGMSDGILVRNINNSYQSANSIRRGYVDKTRFIPISVFSV